MRSTNWEVARPRAVRPASRGGRRARARRRDRRTRGDPGGRRGARRGAVGRRPPPPRLHTGALAPSASLRSVPLIVPNPGLADPWRAPHWRQGAPKRPSVPCPPQAALTTKGLPAMTSTIDSPLVRDDLLGIDVP